MPLYLYALIGAFLFAIVHGMHFTVAPLPGAHAHVTTLNQRQDAQPKKLFDGGVFGDFRHAGL